MKGQQNCIYTCDLFATTVCPILRRCRIIVLIFVSYWIFLISCNPFFILHVCTVHDRLCLLLFTTVPTLWSCILLRFSTSIVNKWTDGLSKSSPLSWSPGPYCSSPTSIFLTVVGVLIVSSWSLSFTVSGLLYVSDDGCSGTKECSSLPRPILTCRSRLGVWSVTGRPRVCR